MGISFFENELLPLDFVSTHIKAIYSRFLKEIKPFKIFIFLKDKILP